MRTVLVTGPGGSGRTTSAAATAVRAARNGCRTLLLSADPALAGVLDHPVDTEPTEVEADLYALRIDSAAYFREEGVRLQQQLAPALDLLGMEGLDPEELTELPGTGAMVLLRVVRDEALSGDWDLLVVDCPPVAATIRALAVPEQLRRYLQRILPPERQAARTLRPLLATLAGMPMPAEWLYSAASWVGAELASAQRIVEDNATTVRLVVEPGPLAGAELRRARAALGLFGHRLEAVVANRVLPSGSDDPWLSPLAGRQRQDLKAMREECAGTAVVELPHLGRAPIGADDLADLGGVLGVERRPEGPAAEPWTVEQRAADGEFVWQLPLPGATRPDLDLVRRGDELVIDVGPHRRIVTLPSALRRCTVTGASLRDGVLQVRFAPDSELWPSG